MSQIKKRGILLFLILVCIITSSCIQTVTTPIPTDISKNVITKTFLPNPTATQTSHPETAREDTGYEGYYIGIVIITEFYTLLSNGLSEKAYNLLSITEKSKYTLEHFVDTNKGLSIEVVAIQPLKIWQLEQGVSPLVLDQVDKISFIAEVATQQEENKGNKETQTQFITLIKMNDTWRIDSFSEQNNFLQLETTNVIPTLNPGTVPNRSYYDGISTIAQYHVLFNNELYENAYQLLSSFRRDSQSLEEFISDINTYGITERRIVSIRPFYEGTLQLQTFTTPDVNIRRMFYAEIYAEGKGGWAGSVPNGIYGYYITIVLEKDSWKIYSVNTVGLP